MQPVDERGRMVEKLLGGRYEVFGFLGRGGFASVYQVRSASLQRFEALKVLHESHGEDSDFVQRFRQEARVAASLEHPSIVKVYDFGHVEGMLWYSMQFVEGPSLSAEIKARGRFDEEAAARIMVPLLDALDYSHARGVIHRDIKPDNVLLDKRGRPFLMDFGIAKIGESLVKTQTGFILGSPAYLSPEQLRGQPLDGRTDVYSLGVTLYQMLAGIIPYRTENMSALARRLTEDAPRLSGRREDIHPELERIVHRSLERDRDARYANAAEMRDDLEAFLAEVHPKSTRARAASSESSAQPARPEPARPKPEPLPARRPDPPLIRPLAPPAVRPPDPLPAALAPAPKSRPAWLWPATFALVVTVLAALAGGWLLTRAPAPSPIPAPAATPAPTPAPTLAPAPANVSTNALAVPTAPAPMAVPTPVPAAQPPALPAPTRVRREAPARAAALAKTLPPPDAIRRAKTPPDVAEEATISLTPAQERECGGKVVGVSVVVAEDGSLRSRHVISSASAACDAIALEAVTRNRYKAALDERGRPIEGRFLLSIRF
ncbi:MAG TPA: serine/threonine-protein kinase [Thermoanaerobaculia bacterium]